MIPILDEFVCLPILAIVTVVCVIALMLGRYSRTGDFLEYLRNFCIIDF